MPGAARGGWENVTLKRGKKVRGVPETLKKKKGKRSGGLCRRKRNPDQEKGLSDETRKKADHAEKKGRILSKRKAEENPV